MSSIVPGIDRANWYPAPDGAFPNTDSCTVYVSPNGSDSLNGYSPANAKQTLAGALAMLSTVQAAHGSRILVSGIVTPGSSSTLTLPSGAILQGVGRRSAISWATDLGSSVPGLMCSTGNPYTPTICDLTLLGPAGVDIPTPGTAPASMWGVQTGVFTVMRNVFLSGFYANIAVAGNHEAFYDIVSQGGWYNLYMVANPSLGTGGQKFYNVILYTAARASIGVGSKNWITSAQSEGLESGQAPYGIYKETESGTFGILVNSNMNGLSFESMGNGLIYDSNTVSGTSNGIVHTFTDFGNNTCSYNATWKDSSLPSAYAFYAESNYWTIGVTAGGAFSATPPSGTGTFGAPYGTNTPRYL